MIQAARSVAVEVGDSKTMHQLWNISRNWHQLASPDYTAAVDAEIESLTSADKEFEQPNWRQTIEVLIGNFSVSDADKDKGPKKS